MGRKQLTADSVLAMLIFVTLIWGMTFIWMKIALNEAEHLLGTDADLGVLKTLIVALRFLLAFILLLMFHRGSRQGLRDSSAIKGGMILGLLMFGGFWLQIWAIEDVTPAVSAFLTSLYVVFTAIVGTAIGWQRLTRWLIVGVVLATGGAAILGLNSEMGAAGLDMTAFGWPEWLTVAGAFLFALHILATDRITKQVDPLQVSLTSFGIVAIAGFLTMILVMLVDSSDSLSMTDLVTLSTSWRFTGSIVCLGVFGSLCAITLLNYCQRFISPLRAALIYALEPVWALLFSIMLGLEILSIWLWIGGGALLAGNLLVELPRVLKLEGHASDEEA